MLAYLLPQLDARGLAYVDIMNANVEPYFRWFGFDKPYLSFDLHREARKHYKGVLMANGGEGAWGKGHVGDASCKALDDQPRGRQTEVPGWQGGLQAACTVLIGSRSKLQQSKRKTLTYAPVIHHGGKRWPPLAPLPSTCPLPCSCHFCPSGLTVEMAEEYVKDGTADLVSFATTFLSTPNLPAAVAAGKRNKDLNLAGANPAIW